MRSAIVTLFDVGSLMNKPPSCVPMKLWREQMRSIRGWSLNSTQHKEPLGPVALVFWSNRDSSSLVTELTEHRPPNLLSSTSPTHFFHKRFVSMSLPLHTSWPLTLSPSICSHYFLPIIYTQITLHLSRHESSTALSVSAIHLLSFHQSFFQGFLSDLLEKANRHYDEQKLHEYTQTIVRLSRNNISGSSRSQISVLFLQKKTWPKVSLTEQNKANVKQRKLWPNVMC